MAYVRHLTQFPGVPVRQAWQLVLLHRGLCNSETPVPLLSRFSAKCPYTVGSSSRAREGGTM